MQLKMQVEDYAMSTLSLKDDSDMLKTLLDERPCHRIFSESNLPEDMKYVAACLWQIARNAAYSAKTKQKDNF